MRLIIFFSVNGSFARLGDGSTSLSHSPATPTKDAFASVQKPRNVIDRARFNSGTEWFGAMITVHLLSTLSFQSLIIIKLSVYLPACPCLIVSACLPSCLPACLTTCPYLSACLPVSLDLGLSAFRSVCLPLSLSLPAHLSLSVCQPPSRSLSICQPAYIHLQ